MSQVNERVQDAMNKSAEQSFNVAEQAIRWQMQQLEIIEAQTKQMVAAQKKSMESTLNFVSSMKKDTLANLSDSAKS